MVHHPIGGSLQHSVEMMSRPQWGGGGRGKRQADTKTFISEIMRLKVEGNNILCSTFPLVNCPVMNEHIAMSDQQEATQTSQQPHRATEALHCLMLNGCMWKISGYIQQKMRSSPSILMFLEALVRIPIDVY